jgi:hypothetical protein
MNEKISTIVVAIMTLVSMFVFYHVGHKECSRTHSSIVKFHCKDGELVFLVENTDGSRQWTKAERPIGCGP